MSIINTQVQPFKTQAFHNGQFIEVTEQAFHGKWSVVIFMPAAFTFNCPTEIEDAADNYAVSSRCVPPAPGLSVRLPTRPASTRARAAPARSHRPVPAAAALRRAAR